MDIKGFGKNTLFYAVSNVSLRAASFLLIPLYTHCLAVSEYGLLATVLLTIQLFIILIDVGLRRAYIRFAPAYEEQNKIGQLLASSLIIKLFNGTVLFLILFFFLKHLYEMILKTNNVDNLLLLVCLAAIAQAINESALSFFRARNESKPFLFLSLLTVLLLIVSNIIWIIILKKGIHGVLFAQIFSYGIVAVLVLSWLAVKHHFSFSYRTVKQLLIYGLPLVLAMSGDIVLEISAVYMLGFFRTMEDVAIYTLGYKIAQISAMIVLYPFQMAFEPYVFAFEKQKGIKMQLGRLFTYYILIFIIVGVFIIIFFKDAIHLIAPKDYSKSYQLIFFILPGFALAGLHFIGQTLLHIQNKTKTSGITILSFTAFAVLGHYLLIPHFGIYAVILIFNLTLLGITMVLLHNGFKTFPLELEKKRLTVLALIGLGLPCLLYVVHDQNTTLFYGVTFIGLLLGISGLVFFNFFSNQEKTIFKTLAAHFKIAGF